MSYEKQTWETGDVITAEKLNNMENGIDSNQRLVVTITEDSGDYSADKTFNEVMSAITAGKEVVASNTADGITTLYSVAYYGSILDNEVITFISTAEIVSDNVESTVITFSDDGSITYSYNTYTTNNIYCVPGDFADDDTIDDEFYDRIASNVYDNGGVAFIHLTGELGEPFIAVITNFGILPITPVDHDYGITISDESPHTITVVVES